MPALLDDCSQGRGLPGKAGPRRATASLRRKGALPTDDPSPEYGTVAMREITVQQSAAIGHVQPGVMEGGGQSIATRTAKVTAYPEPDKISTPQFSALEYVPTAEAGVTITIKHVILLVVRRADGVLQFLAHPNLHEVVEVTRLTYVCTLVAGRSPGARQKRLGAIVSSIVLTGFR